MRKRPSFPSAHLGGSSPPSIVALEKRIAFDGAAAATAAKVTRATATADVASHPFVDASRDMAIAHQDRQTAHGLARPDTAGAAQALRGLDVADGDLRAPARPTTSKSVVFIESDVPDVATLIKDVDHSAQIVLLDPSRDGVDAIASYLAAHKDVRDVYIFSHGSQGQLDLGTATLDTASMQGRYAVDLATIKGALAPGANILVYGCDFAEGDAGDAAAHLLSRLTGAAVAASTDLTGGTAEGGDFVLEDHVGAIDAPDVLSARIATDYDGLLATQTTGAFTINTGTSGSATSSATVATATTADGAVKVVVTVTPNSSNSAGSITTSTANAAFDTTAPAGSYPTSVNGASALEETLLFGGSTANGATDGANNATISIAYYDAKTGAAISVTNPVIDIDRVGGLGKNSSGNNVSNSSDLSIATTGATLTRLSGSSSAFNVSSSDIYNTLNTTPASSYTADANADPTKGTAAGAVEVNGTYSTLTFNWAKASGSLNGGDRIDLIFSADTAMAQNGNLASKSYSDGQSGIAIATSQAFSDPSGLPTTYTASGLPAGLSIDASTGQITGTIDHDASENAPTTTGTGASLDGTYTVTVTATNDANNAATQTFTIDSRNQAPVVGTATANQSNSDGDTIAAVDASKAFTDPNGDPLTYGASGLPAGLSISSAGLITGTVAKNAQPGTDSVVVTATDDKGAATTETFSWTVADVPPAKTGTLANESYNDGQSGISIATSQGFSDANGNALTYGATGLPSGLSIDASTGQITGTIDHDASKNAPAKSGTGASLDGTYTVTETASDGLGGSTTQTFTIDSRNQAPVVGTATANQSNSDGDTIAAVDASKAFTDPNGDPLTYGASGLPAGLSISSAGLITGTVAKNAQPGTDSVVVTATDDKGAATTETFSWTVADVPPAKNGTLANESYNDGQSGISIATSQGFSDANGNALTYGATGLPSGLSIDAGTGQITGTIDHDASKNAPAKSGTGASLDGTYTVTETASDGLGGSTTQTFTIDSRNQAPVVGTATANQSNSDGDTIAAVDASKAFTDPNGDPLTYGASGLPAGLSISSAGLITGTVAKNAQPGTDSVVVTATDDKGAATTETFSWTVADVPPAKTGTLANESYNDGQSGISIATSQGFSDANGNALTYGATGLPSGLSIDAGTGQITGTIDHDASKNAPAKSGTGASLDGTYTVTETASDGLGGSTTQTFTIDSRNQAPVVGTATANQSNSDGDTIAAVDASKAFTDPNGDPLTYGASGLPAGLSISSAGLITGTVAKNAPPGTDSVVVTATDDKGAATTETFSWSIGDVPPTTKGTLSPQTYSDGQSGIAIATAQAFASSNGNALTYSASGLPAGLSIDPKSGQITGTIDHDASKNAPVTTGSGATLDGTYKVVVTASDGLGGSAMQSFTIDSSNGAPVVGTNTAAQSNKTGDTITPVDASKAFSDPNGDPLTYSASGLPKGLTIDPATGLISGTVAADVVSGSYAVRVLATDDKGAATREGFYWTIADTPPTANGTLANKTYADATANIAIATAGAFTSPNGLALSYTASGLPKGLAIDRSSGMITGQLDHDASMNAPVTSGAGATLDGTYTVTVTASDGQGGTAQQVFKIDSTNNAPALVAQTPGQTGADGQTVSLDGAKPFSDVNTGDTFTYAATGLPTGLTIDPTTGLVSGTIDPHASRSGPFAVTVTITDDKGAATSETFKWGVSDVAPVATPALPDRSVNDGTAVSVTTAGGFTNPNDVAYTYSATGLPKGLAIDPNTGVISGTIDHDASTGGNSGTYAIAVTADDGQGGTATNSFHLTSSNQAPVVGTRTADQTTAEGATVAGVDASKAFTDPNAGDAVTYSASNLPPGLSIDPNTGVISGAVPGNATPGAYYVTVTATDDKGAATPETFDWSIDNVPPVANGTLPNQTYKDSTSGIAIATAGGFTDSVDNTLLYSAVGLPAGLSIDRKTGQITGTLDHDASANGQTESGSGATLDGTYTVVVTAKDSLGGSATQTFTIDAKNDAPVTGTTTPVQTNTEGDAVSVDTAIVFSDPNLGDVLTYSATALPPGLSIDPKSGLITGKVATGDYPSSPYQVVVTATDEKGASAQETFSFVTLPPQPAVVSAIPNYSGFDGTAASIATANHFAGSADAATVYTVSGLPSGLSIDATTGQITGTIDHDASKHGGTETGSGATLDGTYDVTVTATNAGGAASQTFALDVANQAPTVGTKTATQTAMTGQTIATVDASQAFSDPNGDPLTFAATGLPTGLTIDAATGKITGTTSATAPGVFSVSVTATDDKGAATIESFAWTVNDTPPVASGSITGKSYPDSTANISINTATGFTSPNNVPLTYRATGLPSGLSIDPVSGIITGQLDHDASKNAPKSGGVYTVNVTADDGQGGTAVQTFTIDTTNTAPAIVNNTVDQHGQDGQSVTLNAGQAFADPNKGDTLTFSASNLPQGLSIDPATGLISGTIADTASKAGTYAVTVTATDDKNAATTEGFDWVVDDLAPQATPPLADRSVNDGAAVSYATSVGFTNPNGVALAYSATGLPSGLSIDPKSGLISGTLDHDASTAVSGGTYTVAVTVNDGQGGTATSTFHLTASNQAPIVVTPLASQSNKDGDTVTSVDAFKAFTDPNIGDTLTYAASDLPKGLAIDPKTGIISGTVAGDAAPGGYDVTVTATDDKGAATSATFTWAINDVPPTAAGTLSGQRFTDSQNGIDIATAGGFSSPNGLPLTYSATGLPRGLSIDPTTGAITGFISHDASSDAPKRAGTNGLIDGTYTVTVTADDGQGGTAIQTFALDSTNQAPSLGMPTADQRAADGQQVSIDAGRSFADPNTGDTLTFAATGLPAGLAIAPATGLITGTIDPHASASRPYTVTVTATDNKGAATPETFHFAVDEVPPTAGAPITAKGAPDGATITAIDTASHFASPNGLPLSYAATGLPAGLSINPGSGLISGTVDHDASKNAPATSGSGATLDGTYTVTVTASDGQGGVATQTFVFDAINKAPAITAQTPDQHGTDGQSVSLDASKAFADPNTGDVVAYAASGLPTGLSIDPATGVITGTIDPRASSAGPFSVTVTATDDKGAATSEAFAWTVADAPPTAHTLPDQAANDGAAVSIATAAGFSDPNGLPLTYAATGLPAGLAIDPATGVISGTLDHDASIGNGNGAGIYTIAVSASDGQGGSATDVFRLTSVNQAPVVGNKTVDQSNMDGATITPVDASRAFADPNGEPLAYAATNLPAGLTIDPATGRITGTVAGNAQPGSYRVAVTATDDKGAAASEAFAWTIADVPPAAKSTLQDQSFGDGTGGIAIATAAAFADVNGNALTFAATGLPAGLAIDPSDGRITGTLDHDASKNAPVTSGSGANLDGTYTVVVTASDGLGGSATQSFTLDAHNGAPVVGTRTADQKNTEGDAVSLDAASAFADPNSGDVLTYSAGNLPGGLAIDPKTGLITGTVAVGDNTSSPYAVSVTATDDKGAATAETLSWTILPLKPIAASPLPNMTASDGTAVALDTASHFATDGAATTYAASGLPAGLSIDPSTGRISGTLDHDASRNAPATTGSGATLDGGYTVTVTATTVGGTTAQSFTLDAANQAPVVGIRTVDQSNKDGDAISPVDASKAFADPNGDPLTYAAANLPAGLSIDPATGRITGTVAGNARPGTSQVGVTATDDKGAATAETFAWTIADVPPTTTGTLPAQTLADGQSGVSLGTAGGFSPSNGNPLAYAATGLPAGLSIDPNTGAITGTLDRNASTGGDHGSYTVTVTASDGLGGAATQTLTIVAANQAPVVGTNTADQHGQDGEAVTLDIAPAFADPNGDALTFNAANLPPGLAIDPATGRIAGTLAANSSAGGPYTVVVTATDSKGAASTETFHWTVDDVPPAAGSTASIDVGPVPDGTTVPPFDASVAFTNPNGLPLTYAAGGLPAGLVIDPATGLITGTLDHDASTGGNHGTYTVTVSVSDGQGGTASQLYTLEATNQAPVLVATTSDQASAQGQSVAPVDVSQAFADPNAGDVVTYAASGLPKGLAIDPATGLITGTVAPDAPPREYAVTIVATDDKGAATSETFQWSIGDVSPVNGGGLPPQRYGDGQGGIAIETAGGFASPNRLPLTYDAGGLPAGLSIDPATGLITGTLDRNASASAPVKLGSGSSLEGIYAVTVTATDPFGGTTSQVFAIEVDNVPPVVVARTSDQHGRAGQAIAPLDLGTAFADTAGDALTYAATGLPPGLAFDPTTGRVTGVIDPALASSRTYTVTVTATDEKGASVAESFLYTVDAVAPSILPPPSFFEPATALLPTLGATRLAAVDLEHSRSVEASTPILDVINQTSGAEEKSQVIALDGIVVSTVNGIAPLNGLERLTQAGEGIVRSGAGTNEIGDRIERTEGGIGRGVAALSTPFAFLGDTSIDVDAAGRGESGPPINIETMLRDRVLSISVGSGAGPGDPLARVAVTLVDGRPLPAWLRADGKGYLVGKVPGGVERIDLKVTSTFASGATSQRSVTIRTDRGTITPLAPRPQAGRTLSHMVGAAGSAAADLVRIARLLD